MDGKLLDHGTVLFEPTAPAGDGNVHSARAMIEPDGTYRLSTFGEADGAVAGQHCAVVLASSVNPETMGGAIQPAVPVKYGSIRTSGLKYEVKPESNIINIELKTQ